MRTALMRQPVAAPNRNQTYDHALVAPINGWVSATNLADPVKNSAIRLENWFPQRRSVRLRGGSSRKATISVTLPTESVFSFENGVMAKLFAATESAIYNITSVADPLVPPAADVSGQTSGRYSTVPFATAGGTTYLTVVNGTDARRLYDGTTWATAPAITGVTGDTNGNTLSHAWVFANRLFFVQKDTMLAWYLAVDAIGGAAAGSVNLAGVFQRGGSLLTGGTWSVDAGDGMHDQCVFISTNGEAVVYQGTDPTSATTWAKVGRYDIGKVLGKLALLKVAGDLLLLTADGFVPMSMVQRLDRAALSLNAVSRDIEPDWKEEAVARGDNWSVVKWPEKNMTIIGIPTATNQAVQCFVVNSETGKWCKYTGWDTNCMCMFQGFAYFGTSDGTILQAEVGGDDDGANYECVYVGQFENWGREGVHKVAKLMRSTFISSVPFTPKISVSTNYSTVVPNAPGVAAGIAQSVWDVGLWDVATWDTEGNQTIQTRWRSVSGQGFAMAPVVQVTCGGVNLPDAQMIVNHVRYEAGAVVT